MVVLITLETKIGEVEGMTNLCIPYITIEPVISKLSAQYWYSSIRKGATDENMNIIQSRLETVLLPVIAEIGEVDVAMEEVMNLSVGDVVKLPGTKLNSEMVLKIAGRKKFKCRPGVVGNRISIQVGEGIEDIPDELLISKRSKDDI
jgi:flagellar motor switch protein FliM